MSPFVWLAIAAIAAIVEVFSWGLFTMWFVIGGLLAFVVGFLGGPLWLQIVVFLVVSVACLLLLRPLILKHRKQGEEFEATPVGGTAVVVERIDNGAHVGRVETSDHMTWAATEGFYLQDLSITLTNVLNCGWLNMLTAAAF